MITKEEVLELLKSTESFRVERTISTVNMDKFCEAICAFANDMPGSRKNGYLIIGANDDGSIAGMTITDALMKKIVAIRSDGNILPLPTMAVERFVFPEGDLLVAEVRPSDLPPVRYRGRVFIRIGPRRDIATETEERILAERRCSFMATFDAKPCLSAGISDLDVDYVTSSYLPLMFDRKTLATDKRDIKEQLASIHLYDRDNDCPTYAGIILFGKNPQYFLLGDYVQFVRFAGKDKSGSILNERRFSGPLCKMLPALETFVKDGIITQRPVPETLFREKTVWNYPEGAIRELMMNACMHRDYQSNMPIRLYQFDDYIEIMNAGGLYGEARPENFPLVNDYRNPLVAEAMRIMKYVNKFNRGISRVQEMLKDNGNPAASFDVNTITTFRVNVSATREIDLSTEHTSGSIQPTSQTSKTHKSTPQNPQVGDKNPQVEDKNPQVGVKNPQVGVKNPQVEVKNPQVGDKNPQVGDKNPQVEDKNPQVGDKNPQVGDKNPQVKPPKPISQRAKALTELIVAFCKEPRSLSEIVEHFGFKDKHNFKERYIKPLLGNRIQMTIPDKPTSRLQKYITY